MKVINGKDIAWDDNINFDIKVIDIDFYNSTNRTLFLGHTGDDKSTLVHLVIPTEHGSNNNVYMSIKSDSGVTSTVIPKYINNNEYYFSITKDFTNISSKGYVQFFVRDTNSNDELVVIAASNKIPYIIDEALEINIIEPSEEEEIGLLEQAINSIQSLMSSKANVADVYRKNEVYSKTEADTLLSSKANKGTTLTEYGITDAYTKTEINNKLASVYKYKGSVSTYQNLPNTNLTVGDVYNVESTGANYAWTGSNWDELGGTVDLSGYQTKIDNNNKLSSDLVDDTNQTNKFVTDTDKTTWNNKLSSANGAVKSSNIDNGAVTTAKLASGAVTSDKIDASVVASGIIYDFVTALTALDTTITDNGTKPVASRTLKNYLEGSFQDYLVERFTKRIYAHETHSSGYDADTNPVDTYSDGGVYIDEALDPSTIYIIKNTNGAHIGTLLCAHANGYNRTTQIALYADGRFQYRYRHNTSGVWDEWENIARDSTVFDAVVRNYKDVAADITFNIHNTKVDEFLQTAAYDSSDYSYSNLPTADGTNWDRPNTMTIDIPSGSSKIVFYDTVTKAERVESTSGTTHTVDNLIPNRNYAYTVRNSSGEMLMHGIIKATGQLRMINAGGDDTEVDRTFNIRDLGGWTATGGKLKYGLVYRGGELNGSISISSAQQAFFKDVLGIRHDIDLRDSGEPGVGATALGCGVNYYHLATGRSPYVLGDNDTYAKKRADVIKQLAKNIKNGEPTYIHCQAGADRTGVMCVFLKAICGVSQSDIDRDQELSYYSYQADAQRVRKRNNAWANGHRVMINGTGAEDYSQPYINNMEGSSFQDRIIRLLLRSGVTIDELNDIRFGLIDGNPTALTNPYGNATITKNLSHVFIDNEDTSVKLYQPFEARVLPNDGYILTSVSVTMGGTDITSTAYNAERILIPKVTGDIIITASATDVDIPDVSGKADKATTLAGYGITDGQTKIDSSHKLSSDLVDDTDQTNKFVTDTDKTNWNNKLSSANGAVKSSNIDNGAVTLQKLESGVIDSTLSAQGAAAEAKATGNGIKANAALVAGESLITESLLEPYNATFTNVEYTTTAKKMLMADGTIIDYNSSNISNVLELTPDTLYKCNCAGVGGGGAYFFLYDQKDNISAIYPAVTTDVKNFVFKASNKFKKIQFNVRGSGCYLRAITLNGLEVENNFLEVENNFIELTNHILDTVDYTGLNISFIYPKRIRNDGVIVDYPNGGDTWAVSNEIDISQYDYLKINACAGWGDAYFAVYDENHSPIYFELSPNSAPTIYNANIILPKNAHYLAIAKFGTRFDAYVSYPVFEAPTKKWEGKKWVCIGDSLTEANSTTSKHYFDYIADETGITTANYGIGGTGYANPSGTAGNFTARMASVPTDADVYTIFGSFNDYAYSINNDIPIGTPEDSGTSTICGYINSAFDALFARVPLANLGVVAPCPWVSVNSVTGTTSKTFAENYVSALRQCCERKSIPFLDLYHGSGLRPWDSNFRDLTYTKDTLHGVHPDETGHAILAPKFSAFLDLLL